MNIFWHELRAQRKFTLIWTLALVLSIILFLSLFPSISKEAEGFKKLMEGFPEAVRLALGLAVENIGSILGYYSYVFLYISLIGAIQAMILGMSIISKEVREKTADFLLTKPVSRTNILTAKLLAALMLLVITNLFYLTVANTMAFLVEKQEYSIITFLMVSLTLFFLQLIFLALGIVTSVIVPKIRTVLPIALGSVFGFFILGAIAATTGDEALRYLSPFKYFDLAYIVQHSSYESPFLIVALGIIVIAIATSYWIYHKQDIPTG